MAGAPNVIARYLYSINVCHVSRALRLAVGAMVGLGEEEISGSQVQDKAPAVPDPSYKPTIKDTTDSTDLGPATGSTA